MHSRRTFIGKASTLGAMVGLEGLDSLPSLGSLSASDTDIPSDFVQFRPEIEPIVRLIENSPRNRLIEEVSDRIKNGLSYREVLTGLLLAGVRNIQPRPVGFKFHAVLVVNSAHQASINSPDSDRWLPIFWALDYFKSSQARDVDEGDWTLRAPKSNHKISGDKAKPAFAAAMDNWDVEASDVATSALSKNFSLGTIFDLFSHYGARDYRDIGHKAIYVANCWRTLNVIGAHHKEPVLRSLAYALLAHEGKNPAQRQDNRDMPGRLNLERAKAIRPDWQSGSVESTATQELFEVFQSGTAHDSSKKVVELLNRKISPQSIWDAIFQFCGELLIQNPGIVSLHSFTCSNAIHYAYQNVSRDSLRRELLLQNAAFLPMFRGSTTIEGVGKLAQLETETSIGSTKPSLSSIFETIDTDRAFAANQTHSYLNAGESPEAFMTSARRFLFRKGFNSHDYKFTSAALEDFYHISPSIRNRYLAASIYNLRGSQGKDNSIVERIQSALS